MRFRGRAVDVLLLHGARVVGEQIVIIVEVTFLGSVRQPGAREIASIVCGVEFTGPCGNKLCCVRFLKNFEPVSMKMAKLQRLPLTSGKISGICGRLMCCLFYEYKTYREMSKGLPKEGQRINTPQGKGKVISVNVLKRIVYIEFEDGRTDKIQFDNPDEKPDRDGSSPGDTSGEGK